MIYAKDHDDTINFPIGENDSGTGSLGKRFYIAESEATNQLIKTVLQWAYNNGRFSDNFTDHNGIDSAAAKHGGRTIINLSGSKITFRTETKEFSVENGYQNYPADYVSWYGAVIFCNWLTEMRDSSTDNLAYTGITENWDHNNTVCDYNKTGFRLPSKNEWEYAARYRGNDNTNIVLGYQFPYYTKGNSFSGATATANQYWAGWGEPSKSINDALAVYGQYYNGSSWVQTGVESAAEVMTKTPNTLGLYDMSGNLSEWTFDKYSTTMRYMKGGCWNNPASQLTIGLNATGEPAVLNSNNGFRLARTAD
jgi:formylglycine-generating enzyme required for sulfatase activity